MREIPRIKTIIADAKIEEYLSNYLTHAAAMQRANRKTFHILNIYTKCELNFKTCQCHAVDSNIPARKTIPG